MKSEQLIQIQKLVDGELSQTDRSALLIQLDQSAESWRDVAMAFIEKQILDETFCRASESNEVVEQSPVHLKGPVAKTRTIKGLWYLAIAASLFVGILFGSQLPEPAQNPSDNSEVAKSESTPITEVKGKYDDLSDALSRSIGPLSREAYLTLLQSGYHVDEQRQLARVKLSSGKSIQIPVRKFDVHFLGNAAFQ